VIVLARAGDRQPAHAVGIARTEWDSEIDAIEAAEAAGKALADAVTGSTIERSATRLRLLGLDGTVSWLERRGASLVIRARRAGGVGRCAGGRAVEQADQVDQARCEALIWCQVR